MVGVTPHVGLDRFLMASDDVLPISFSELTEVKLGHFSELTVAFLVSHISFLQIFLREVHALELVKKTNVSKSSVSRA